MSERGRFITFEGIDGAGKSSHLDFACDFLRARGHDVVKTHEPGGTPFGQKIRATVLGEPAPPLAQTLAIFAARAAHVAQVIDPALAAGRWVVCDRFTDSTHAYQCGGHGVSSDAVYALAGLAHPGIQPDTTFLFDIDPSIAQERQRDRKSAPDTFEREQLDFHVRVRNAYLEMQRADPKRIRLIDASASIEEVRTRLERELQRIA